MLRRPDRTGTRSTRCWSPFPSGRGLGSLVFDIASHLVGDPGFLVRGAMWLIALGVIGALSAALVGFLDLFAMPPGPRAFRMGLVHMTLNLLVTVAYAANSLWRHAAHRPDVGENASLVAPGEGEQSGPTSCVCDPLAQDEDLSRLKPQPG
ncbi:DUF2231 domain-containing protein [Streptomyces sp. NPDC001939]